jgi:hypothetical protein
MSKYVGDFSKNDTITFMFTTFRPSTGAPFLLAGTPVVSVYKDNNLTQDTAGVTLTTNYDGVTGLNFVSVSTSTAFYVDGSSYECVITTGTVDSVSVVGSCVGRFTMRDQACLYPTTSGRTLDVSTGGEAGLDWANVGSPTTTVGLSATTIATSQQVASVSGSVGSVASGGITSTSIATDAITSTGLAASATAEIADAILARNLDSSGNEASTTSSGRTVRNALRILRNKIDASTGTQVDVYNEADTTVIWSQPITTSGTADPIVKVGT